MLKLNSALWAFLPYQPITLLPLHERWRRVAKILKLSKEARQRLEWVIYYHEGFNSIQTARHFGISRKTFYKWTKHFDQDNLYSLHLLEDRSRAPKRVRQREITPIQEQRIIVLRKRYLRYGKEKLAVLYQRQYQEKLSSWKVQKIIEKYQLYYHPQKAQKSRLKRQRAKKKKRITELKLDQLYWFQKKAGYLICLDTIALYSDNLKRYIFTAIDKYGKVAYARMYKNKSSQSGEDFLLRLNFLLNGKITQVGHDNGTEFEKYFKQTCQRLNIQQYYSRVKTPKDNPTNERFNRTLQEEFINLGNFSSNPEVFNRDLTQWLVEYNFHRPHQSLNYQTPIQASHLSPMYSSSTGYWKIIKNGL